jgi:hypothetical protein
MIAPHPGIRSSWTIRLLLLISLTFSVLTASACKCEGVNTVAQNYKQAAVVFTGTVLKIEYVGIAETLNPDSVTVARTTLKDSPKNSLDVPMVLKATMVVTKEFKGITKNDTIVVYTGIRGASCGFKFEVNKEYTVYAASESYMGMFLRVDRKRFKTFDKQGVYWTSICTRTTITVGQEQGLLAEHLKK